MIRPDTAIAYLSATVDRVAGVRFVGAEVTTKVTVGRFDDSVAVRLRLNFIDDGHARLDLCRYSSSGTS
ncbi:hypothetical protein GCM10009710_34950 [Aeromicrobium alkaliterrae]|uniref:Uncharacterized protein n=1 Tax=Aeromicrobium alkaliterrae TaxID=302168 RepID=A0ABP4WDM0_9ACTN